MTDEWVLDVTFGTEVLHFCPYNRETGEVLIGMTYISDRPPGKFVGVFHEEGQEAVEEWCHEHADLLDSLRDDRRG